MNKRSIALWYGRASFGMLALFIYSAASGEESLSRFGASLAPAEYDKCTDPDLAQGPFRVIPDQKYALCFPGRCWFFNGVLYCACEKLPEDAVALGYSEDLWDDSISLSLNINDNDQFPDGGNVCNVMENGNDQDYRVSTFSLSPAKGVNAGDDGAVYVCPKDSPGSYAQCDGGLCFEGVSQMTGAEDLFKEQIMCSCPAVTPSANRPAYNVYGPFDPQKLPPNQCKPEDCEAVCGAGSLPPKKLGKGPGTGIPNGTGPNIPIGAPLGSGRFLTCTLAEYQQQTVGPIQECVCQYTPGKKGGDELGTWTATSRTVYDPCLELL